VIPDVVIWRTRFGYRVRVLAERSGSRAVWRPTLASAKRLAASISISSLSHMTVSESYPSTQEGTK